MKIIGFVVLCGLLGLLALTHRYTLQVVNFNGQYTKLVLLVRIDSFTGETKYAQVMDGADPVAVGSWVSILPTAAARSPEKLDVQPVK